MEYTSEEYKKMIMQMNMNKNKKTLWIGAIVCATISFIITTIIARDFYFNLVLSLMAAIAVWFILRKIIVDAVKKVNITDDIVSVEQKIYDNKISQKIIKKKGLQNSIDFYYKDVQFLRQDRDNYYLYFDSNVAIIINKLKIENKEAFKKRLQSNNLLK